MPLFSVGISEKVFLTSCAEHPSSRHYPLFPSRRSGPLDTKIRQHFRSDGNLPGLLGQASKAPIYPPWAWRLRRAASFDMNSKVLPSHIESFMEKVRKNFSPHKTVDLGTQSQSGCSGRGDFSTVIPSAQGNMPFSLFSFRIVDPHFQHRPAVGQGRPSCSSKNSSSNFRNTFY